MAKRILKYSPELNSFGRKLCLAIAGIALATFAFSAHAESIPWDIYQCAPVTTKRAELFKAPTPKIENKRPYDAPYDERFKDNRYRPHYVFYKEKNTWLNVSVVPALETENRDLLLYYTTTQKVFRVHFRNTEEANAATRILLDGLNMPLPPYYVTEE